jgi:dolichyl-phosphate-mannose-protein mannosyltransferase
MEGLTLRPGEKNPLLPILAAAFLLGGYGYFLMRNTAFSVGGSDSSGYMNTAWRLMAGTLVSTPRTLQRYALPDDLLQIFTPLGFVEGPRPGTMAPYYPSGFPAHMAAAALLLGWQRGPFLVAPLTALLSVLLFYLLARELSLSRTWAAAAAAVFAAWPVLIGQAIQPMSDSTATFWALAAVLCAVKARRRNAWALGAGAALGIAVLVRPANLLLVIPLGFALPVTLRALALFLTGGIPFAAALAAYDIHCYGSPLQSGYGKAGLLGAVSLGNFPPRFRHYGGWILRSLTPLIPLAWIGFGADRRAAWRDRALLLSWFASFFLFYCLYEPYDSFWFVRFLLPGVPGLILGAFLAARDLAMRRPRRHSLTAVGVASLIVVFWAEARSTGAVGLLNTAHYESVYPQICAWAAETLPARSVVLSMAASGALEHYTDLAYARWDWIEPAKFPDLRRRIEERGGHWFALLFPFEAEEMFKQPRGRWKKIGVLRDVGLYELEKD